ncbi:MAG: hypothetical protein IAF08_04975 [Rhizobacter sp.]|nr:hypothetical protein [Chlorobiales bacterium]
MKRRMFFLAWLLTTILGCNPLFPEGSVQVRTDKTEYAANETIQVTIQNNGSSPLFLHKPAYYEPEQFIDCEWKTIGTVWPAIVLASQPINAGETITVSIYTHIALDKGSSGIFRGKMWLFDKRNRSLGEQRNSNIFTVKW